MVTTDTVERIERTIYRCRECETGKKSAGAKRPIVAKKFEARYTLVPSGVDRFGNVRKVRRYLDTRPHTVLCGAGHSMRYHATVKGRKVAAIPCTAKCVSATGTTCECACGGANHGAGHTS